MKTLLLATDFSEAAQTALSFSIGIAKHTGAEIIVLNTFEIISWEATPEMSLYNRTLEETKANAKEKLGAIVATVQAQTDRFGKPLRCTAIVIMSDPASEIARQAGEKQADLVVMGNVGFEAVERWYKNVPYEVIKHTHSHTPILAVPVNAVYHSFAHIAYAAEWQIPELPQGLVSFVQTFDSELTLFHAAKNTNSHTYQSTINEYVLQQNESIPEAIQNFSQTKQIDLIALLQHKRPFVASIFHKSTIENLITHSTSVPLLVVRDED